MKPSNSLNRPVAWPSAAAYAQAGRLADAVKTAEKGRQETI
jgi:hypothetical protein